MALEGGGSGGGSARGIRAGAAYVELNGKDNTQGFFAKMRAKFAGFLKGVGTMAAAGLAGGLAAIPLIAAPLVGTIQDLGKIQDVADAFGVTGKAASGLFGVLQAAGGEFKENVEGIIQFSGTLEKAMQDVGQGKELFAGLAVSAKDLSKLPIDEQFYSVLGAIRQLPQPLQEAKLAMLGGTDSMKQWQKLLTMSNDEVRQLADKLAFSNTELRQAAEASKAYQAATLSISRAWQQVAVSVAPVVKDIAQWVERGADGFTQWFKGRSAGNLWDEVIARFKIGMAEAFQWLRNQVYGLWDYLAEGRNFGPLFQKAGEFMKSLVNYFSASLTTVAEQVAKNLGIDPDEQKRQAFGFALGLETDPEKRQNYQSALDILNDPAKLRALKDFQLKQALAPDQKAFDDMLGAWGGLVGEWDKEMAVLAERIEARKRQFAGIDAELLAPLNAQLAAVRAAAERERNTALFAEHIADLMRPDVGGAVGETMDKLTHAIGTFGAGDFLTQGFGIQSAEDVGKKLDKGNKLQAEGNEHLKDIKKKVGPQKFK